LKIKERFNVHTIPQKQAEPWILKKHYAGRMTPIRFSFGLYEDKEIVGVCTFGNSYARKLREKWPEKFEIVELNRLITEDNLPKNALSYFVSQCLKRLPPPMVIVSYADPNHGHHGYIYQATNWIYTGESSSERTFKNTRTGKILHRRTLNKMFDTSSVKEIPDYIVPSGRKEGKHRYFYFVGNKKEKREMKKYFDYEEKPYPKEENTNYDTSKDIYKQQRLF